MSKTSRSRVSNRAAIHPLTELVLLDSLQPAARLTRSHPAHKRRVLEKSIREQGLLDPITINRAGVIVDGHLRVEIAKVLGWREIAAVRIEHLSDEELRLHAIAANRLPGVANLDLEELRAELEEIEVSVPTLDLSLSGLTFGEIDKLRGRYAADQYDDLHDEDKPEGEPAAMVSKPGDLYELGDHRLICGNALEAKVLSRLMGEERARMIFTDPPYNVRVHGHVTSGKTHGEFAMASGEMSRDEFTQFLRTSLHVNAAHLIDGGLAYVCMDHAHLDELLAAGGDVFDARLNICVWDKGQGGMGSFYRSRHELVAVFKRGYAPHINNIQLGKNGRDRSNVWAFPGMGGFGGSRQRARELHPTVKPVALIAEAILDAAGQRDIVLDPFGGSGSTLIAAERVGRRARLVELEPIYVDRTIRRWQNLTDLEAVNATTGQTFAEIAEHRASDAVIAKDIFDGDK